MSATAVHLEGGKKLELIMMAKWRTLVRLPATLEGGGHGHLALRHVKRHHAQPYFPSRRRKVVE